MRRFLGRRTIYPERDGQSISNNAKQFRSIVLLKGNLESLFASDVQFSVVGEMNRAEKPESAC